MKPLSYLPSAVAILSLVTANASALPVTPPTARPVTPSAGSSAGAPSPAPVDNGSAVVRRGSEADCAALVGLSVPEARIVSAAVVRGVSGTPDHCEVTGFAEPAVNFKLRLPLTNWNSKFYMAGCGGYCGTLDDRSHLVGLSRNYATIITDTGHRGDNALDTRWAVGNPSAMVDFAYRGVSEAARVGKAVTRAFYKADISHAYFNGCSNGGRQGLMAATQTPDDFDGIIAAAPGFDIGPAGSFIMALSQADIGPDGEPIFNAAKVDLVEPAVARACGDETGLIDDPLNCRFDPATLACRSGDAPDCLTAAEVEVLNKWYSPPRLKNGELLFPTGMHFGTEPFWDHPNVPLDEVLADAKFIASQSLHNFSPNLPADVTVATFDPETQTPLLYEILRIATPTSDIRRFAERGGKLLVWHGWADQTLPAARTMIWYDEAQASIGGAPQDTARLFLIPGMAHCGNPRGATDVPGYDHDSFDALTALERWVEHGETPEALEAVKYDPEHRPLFTRPICAYPAIARYRGEGDRTLAANWTCEASERPARSD